MIVDVDNMHISDDGNSVSIQIVHELDYSVVTFREKIADNHNNVNRIFMDSKTFNRFRLMIRQNPRDDDPSES